MKKLLLTLGLLIMTASQVSAQDSAWDRARAFVKEAPSVRSYAADTPSDNYDPWDDLIDLAREVYIYDIAHAVNISLFKMGIHVETGHVIKELDLSDVPQVYKMFSSAKVSGGNIIGSNAIGIEFYDGSERKMVDDIVLRLSSIIGLENFIELVHNRGVFVQYFLEAMRKK